MNIEHNDNFISVFSNVFPDGYCKHIVDTFDNAVLTNNVGTDRSREGPRHFKDDYNHFNHIHNIIPRFKGEDVNNIFYGGLQECFDEYINKYSILKQQTIKSNQIKIQRSKPGQGYHAWHTERSSGPITDITRVLVYILYLNTLDETQAGETEFLYQQKRFRPVENTMLIWPAEFTHVHRGNPVYGSSNKYIMTGWFNYNDD